MTSLNPLIRSVELSSTVKSEQVTHRYGRFAVREISDPGGHGHGSCTRLVPNSVIASHDVLLNGTHEGKSQQGCFVAVEEMRIQAHGIGNVTVHCATKEGSILSPPEGVVLSGIHSSCPSPLSVNTSEMESNSNSFIKSVQIGLQNLDIVATTEALQPSNDNAHQQGNVICHELVSKLLLQNQALLDRLSALDLPMTECPPLMPQRNDSSKGSYTGGTSSVSSDGRLGGCPQPPKMSRFSSDPSGVYSHARLKNALDQMREEIDFATSQRRERDIELNCIRDKNRSLNERLQAEQLKVSALETKLERSQQTNRLLREEVDYLSSSVNNNAVVPSSNDLVETTTTSTRSLSSEDYSTRSQHQQKHAGGGMNGDTPTKTCDMRKMKQSECDNSHINYASNDHIPLSSLTPEKTLQCGSGGGGVSAAFVQRQLSAPPLNPHVDEWNRRHSHIPTQTLNHCSSSSYDMTSNMYGTCGVSRMPGPQKNSARPEDVNAFIMSSFQQQQVCSFDMCLVFFVLKN